MSRTWRTSSQAASTPAFGSASIDRINDAGMSMSGMLAARLAAMVVLTKVRIPA